MANWRSFLPSFPSPDPEQGDCPESPDVDKTSNIPKSNILLSIPNERLGVSRSVTVSSREEVFHSARASPIHHRNSMSSNRMPSPPEPDSAWHNQRRPSTSTAYPPAPSRGPRQDRPPPILVTSHYSSEKDHKSNAQPTSLPAKKESDTENDTNVVIYPTRTVSRKYLHPPKREEDYTPWDQGLDFDLGEFSLGDRLEPVIAQHLENAVRQYQSADTHTLGQPSTSDLALNTTDVSVKQPISSRKTETTNYVNIVESGTSRVAMGVLDARRPSTTSDGQPKELSTSKKTAKPSDHVVHKTIWEETAESGTDDGEFCCEISKKAPIDNPEIAYCFACKTSYCPRCWKKQLPHKKGKPGHEKVDAVVARMIQDTLDVDVSEAEQARLHLLDECASWFGAIRDGDTVVFRDFGRYASLMADHSLESRKRICPALISFVGETGAGKSSLVKLLVGIKKSKQVQDVKSPTQTPVVGNSSAEAPTSGDVHLYADPQTFFEERPLLYADCEGLRGGTLDPIGAKRRRRPDTSTHTRNRTASFEKYMRRRHETAERDIAWARTSEKKTRKFFVENLYPRLLYTFSDVIVLVVPNARTIEEAVEQLLVWADAVIETASNQPVLPHAIIVLNASKNTKKELWDVDASTIALLDKISLAVWKNPKLTALADRWNSRGFNITSVQSLLLVYYSSFRVVRIPEGSRPLLIHDQIQRLYDEITASAAASHNEKHQKRVKLNAEALQPYLQQAFDHFCHDLNDPFDFIKASFADSGIPSDFSGNILKLAVNIMNRWQNKIDGSLLFRELSFIVASCVMLDAVRNRKLGLAGPVFKQYIDHFDETLDDFCEKIWPCEFVSSKGRCVNVRAGHTQKGHQLSRGQILAAGDYVSHFTAETYRQEFRSHIFTNLQELLSSLTTLTGNSGAEHEAASKLHESMILGPFYRHVGGAENFVSHSACLSCLVLPAQHCLPCGHVVCTQCAKDFGTPRGQNQVEMKFCPLHKDETLDLRQMVMLKPDNAGVRVLSLDGGGVRGVIMLETLLRMELDMGGYLPIASFFDLIIGTSTGGIIALGLVEMGWSVKQCLKKFELLASTAFQKHKTLGSEYLDWLVAGFQHGRYRVEPLEDLLRTEYTERNLFGGVRDDSEFSPRNHIACKVGVTTTATSGTPYVLANYNRLENDENSRYGFLRSEKPEQEIRVCEAARATSAAPKIFKPYGHTGSGQTFVDGGVYYNNPIEIALREQNLLWPQNRPRLPDIVLSLGTGHGPRYFRKEKKTSNAPAGLGKSPVLYYRQLLKIAIDHVKSSQRSEDEYQRIRQHYNNSPQASSCFIRFNMLFDQGIPKPDSVASLPSLIDHANRQLDSRTAEIRYITNRMIASCFYFDPAPGSIKKEIVGSITLQGHIRCRFQGPQLQAFGDLLKTRCQESFNSPGGWQHSPCFVLEDRSRPTVADQVVLSDSIIDGMINQGRFNLRQITITLMNSNAESDIHLRFGAESLSAANNSISGFPKCWDDRKVTPMTSRLNLSDARGRLPSRRGRPDWYEPTTANKPILGRYAQERNPGLATDAQLRAVEDRLSEPVASHILPQELVGSPPTSFKTEFYGRREVNEWVQAVKTNYSPTQASEIGSQVSDPPRFELSGEPTRAFELGATSTRFLPLPPRSPPVTTVEASRPRNVSSISSPISLQSPSDAMARPSYPQNVSSLESAMDLLHPQPEPDYHFRNHPLFPPSIAEADNDTGNDEDDMYGPG